MTRIACLMMQKDEAFLLRPWLLYHGYMFGFENLFVYDNGSSSPVVLEDLQIFRAAGVHVEYARTEPQDFQDKGRILGERILEFQARDQYDLAIPLDCDEFLAVNGEAGISCRRADVRAELARIHQSGIVCRTRFCLDNRPGFVDLFRYIGHEKSIPIVGAFKDIDHGFHQAWVPPGTEYGVTSIIHIHMHFKPFDYVKASARNKLQPYVDVDDPAALRNFSGVGNHLVKYFLMSEHHYYRDLHGYRGPLVRFAGFAALLTAVMPFAEFRRQWEAGRPGQVLDDVLAIDFTGMPFSLPDYLEANPDLPRTGLDHFMHYLTAGYVEGRRLQNTPAGDAEVVGRLAVIRSQLRDGKAGYAGVALAMSRVGQGAAADQLLRAAFIDHGETAVLLREYALSAMYRADHAEAARRWRGLRDACPGLEDGYRFGAISCRDAGAFTEAEQIIAAGLARFPESVSLALEQAQLAAESQDISRARFLYQQILAKHPHDREVRNLAGAAMFQLKLREFAGSATPPVDVSEGPVSVDMTGEECEAALQYLQLPDQSALREFFMQFESMGDSCEFGLVQRRHGAEPIGLLRWNIIHFDRLIAALQTGFAGIDTADNLRLSLQGREYLLHDEIYATSMHTFSYADKISPDRLMPELVKRTGFLRRKFLAELAEGEKIFVYLDYGRRELDEIRQLHAAFATRSKALLLYVGVATAAAAIGTVAQAGPGLLVGSISRLGRDAAGVWKIAFADWLSICRAAALYRDEARPG